MFPDSVYLSQCDIVNYGQTFLYLPEVEDGLLCTFLRLLLKTEVF